jgi:PAS domain S-box-containing protein
LVEEATSGLPQFATVGAIDPNGEWLCRSGGSAGLGLIANAGQWREAALAAAEPEVVGYVPGIGGSRPLFVVVRSFTNLAGGLGGALVVGIDLDWLRDHFAKRNLPEGGSITIADRAGRVLVRLPGPQQPGDPIQNMALLQSPRAATSEGIGPDGIARIVGYVPPAASGDAFLVLVGIAKAPAMAAIDGATRRGVVLIGLGALLAVLAAWLGAKLFIRRPARALLSASEAWGRGDLAARTGLPSGRDEFGRLAAAFDSMAGLLQAREVELRHSDAALRERNEMLALVEQSAEIGAWEVDIAAKMVRGTPHFFRLHGVEPSEGAMPHVAIRASQHPDDLPRVAAEFEQVVASAADQFEVEYRVRRADGAWRWLLGRGHVVRDASGRATAYAGIDMDITGRKQAEAALRDGEARLRLALEAGRMGVFDTDLESQTVIWDDTERQLFGIGDGQAPTTPAEVLDLVHRDDREAFRATVAKAMAAVADYRSEFRIVLPGGGTRWLAQRGMVLRDGQGGLRLTGVDWDITERKQLEQRQHLLIGELNHRVKNLLAVIQSIVQQSGRQAATAEALQESLRGRLRAMAVAHEILATRHWGGAELEAVLRGTLAPHIEGEPDRLLLDVEPAVVDPPTAQSLSLAIHELATNAIKYGAWSVPGGKVRLEGRAQGARGLTLTWTESGGPPVEPPSRKGFGSLLLSRAFAYETGGEAVLDWRADGLRCVIRLPKAG